jgi:hypothetical protein
MEKRFRVWVEFEYNALSTQEEQVELWSRHMERVGLVVPSVHQTSGVDAALIKIVEVDNEA